MIFLLKIIFKELKDLIVKPKGKNFMWLVLRYGRFARYHQKKIEIDGFKIISPDILSFIWQYKEIFTDESYKFKTQSVKPLIFDCGANIGVSCLYFSRNYPDARIKAFEADPNIAGLLKKNLENNNLLNTQVVDKAVWIENGEINISIEGADGASIHSNKNPVKVECVRLKELLENEIKIDLLKMDIEGAEYEVILDCRDSLKNVDNIFIEYHSFTDSPQKLSEILSILENNNFRYFIKPVNDREIPFINRTNKNNPSMDLQLNIFGYR